jgi:hypothetical protein
MRIPFFRKKKPAKTTVTPVVQIRNEDGTYGESLTNPRKDISRIVAGEQSAIQGTVTVLKEVVGLSNMINDMATQKAEDMIGEPEPSFSLGSEWAGVVSQALPYIAPYLPGLIEKYAGVKPQATSAPDTQGVQGSKESAPVGSDMAKLIGMASKAPIFTLKASLPILKGELEQRGIAEDDFKKAIANLAKAYKVDV